MPHPTTPSLSATNQSAVLIQPPSGLAGLRIAELWQYRDLLIMLALRDIQLRYKQTALGVIWAVLQPILAMLVFTLIFGVLLNVQAQTDTPYPIFAFAGLIGWNLFASSVSASTNSLVNNANMLKKIYFPRLLMPLASLAAPLVDFAVSLIVLAVLLIIYQVPLGPQIALLPFALLTIITTVAGLGILMASLTVSFRDVRHTVPFLIQTLFFLTPVIYPVTLLPPQYRWLLAINPMSGSVAAMRATILNQPIDFLAWTISAIVSIALLTTALIYFQRVERDFADIV